MIFPAKHLFSDQLGQICFASAAGAEKQENARQLRQQAEATVAEIKKLLEESE